jgi:hypothetical protein
MRLYLDELDSYNGGYRCDFSKDYCDWSLSGPMKWERIKVVFYISILFSSVIGCCLKYLPVIGYYLTMDQLNGRESKQIYLSTGIKKSVYRLEKKMIHKAKKIN